MQTQKRKSGKRQYKGKEVLCSIPGIPPLWCLKTPPVTGVLAGPHLILPPVNTGPRQTARQLQDVSKCGHKERTFNSHYYGGTVVTFGVVWPDTCRCVGVARYMSLCWCGLIHVVVARYMSLCWCAPIHVVVLVWPDTCRCVGVA